jgi:hypothetical protein
MFMFNMNVDLHAPAGRDRAEQHDGGEGLHANEQGPDARRDCRLQGQVFDTIHARPRRLGATLSGDTSPSQEILSLYVYLL